MKLIARGVNIQAKVYTFVGFIQLQRKKKNEMSLVFVKGN